MTRHVIDPYTKVKNKVVGLLTLCTSVANLGILSLDLVTYIDQ